MKYLIALCLLAFPVTAAAETAAPEPRSVQDCERIKVDLAYNQCLAKFGPAARTRPGTVAPGQDPEVATPANPRRFGRLAKRKGRVLSRGRQRVSVAMKSSRRHGRRAGRRRR